LQKHLQPNKKTSNLYPALVQESSTQASFDFQQPYAHAAYFSRLATFDPEYTVESLRAATAKVTREAVRKFSELLRSKEQTFFGQVGGQGCQNVGFNTI